MHIAALDESMARVEEFSCAPCPMQPEGGVSGTALLAAARASRPRTVPRALALGVPKAEEEPGCREAACRCASLPVRVTAADGAARGALVRCAERWAVHPRCICIVKRSLATLEFFLPNTARRKSMAGDNVPSTPVPLEHTPDSSPLTPSCSPSSLMDMKDDYANMSSSFFDEAIPGLGADISLPGPVDSSTDFGLLFPDIDPDVSFIQSLPGIATLSEIDTMSVDGDGESVSDGDNNINHAAPADDEGHVPPEGHNDDDAMSANGEGHADDDDAMSANGEGHAALGAPLVQYSDTDDAEFDSEPEKVGGGWASPANVDDEQQDSAREANKEVKKVIQYRRAATAAATAAANQSTTAPAAHVSTARANPSTATPAAHLSTATRALPVAIPAARAPPPASSTTRPPPVVKASRTQRAGSAIPTGSPRVDANLTAPQRAGSTPAPLRRRPIPPADSRDLFNEFMAQGGFKSVPIPGPPEGWSPRPASPENEYPASPANEHPASPANEYPASPANEYPASPANEYPASPASDELDPVGDAAAPTSSGGRPNQQQQRAVTECCDAMAELLHSCVEETGYNEERILKIFLGRIIAALEAKEKKKKKNTELHPRPKLKLRILPPKTPDPVQRSTPAESPQITPPPPVPPKELQAAVSLFMLSKGYDPKPADTDSEDDNDELEELMKKKGSRRNLFSHGMVDDTDTEDQQNKASPAKDATPEQYEDEDHDESGEDNENIDKSESESDGKSVHYEFELKFSVPFEGANTTLKVSSNIVYSELLSQLADTMSLPPKDVHVAYRFSTQIRSDPFSHLSKSIHLIELVATARDAQRTTKSKKEFKVELKDLGVNGKGKSAAKDGKGKKDKKKRKYRGDSDSEDSDDVDEDKVKKKKSMPQLVVELQEANACTEHSGDGCLKYTTGHVPLTKQDLSTWAIFLKNGYTSTTTPPPKLQVGGNKPGTAKTTPATPAPVPPAPPGFPPMPPGISPVPFGYHPYQWPMPQPWSMYQTPTATPMSKRRYEDVLSSPPEVVEDDRLFPRIGVWLQELDDGPRGIDEHNFAQFGVDFDRERYVRVVDLERLKVDELKRLIPEIAHGTASKLLAYAAADIGAIRKQARKRSRKESQSHGSRYT
ncbi:hypothetical protein GGX14DRAFT_575515 [Mycena pura]|uniref:Uncharacterized protein n=1 Tax=Mycena pura TaxID=153505 RepID=A0AAD6UYS4_9AGAR|nr:hypothetical protein GGX14DRAFT_575515 [Mycena pura]